MYFLKSIQCVRNFLFVDIFWRAKDYGTLSLDSFNILYLFLSREDKKKLWKIKGRKDRYKRLLKEGLKGHFETIVVKISLSKKCSC